MFNEQKTAQMAAFFLYKSENCMPVLKLIKLLYLADRASLDLYGMPMSGDLVVAMPHGPVLSKTYDLMNGDTPAQLDGWDAWITDRENHEVSLASHAQVRIKDRDSFDELSDSDIEDP